MISLEETLKSWFSGNTTNSIFDEKGQKWGKRIIDEQKVTRPQYLTINKDILIRVDLREPKTDEGSVPETIIYLSKLESMRKKVTFLGSEYLGYKLEKLRYHVGLCPTREKDKLRLAIQDGKILGKTEDLEQIERYGINAKPWKCLNLYENIKILESLPDDLQKKLSPVYEYFKNLRK